MCAQMWLLFVVLQVAAKIGKKLACGLRAADFARFERSVVVVEKSRKTGHGGISDRVWLYPALHGASPQVVCEGTR